MNKNIVEILVDDYKNSGDHVREKLDLHPEYLELTFEGIKGILKRTV